MDNPALLRTLRWSAPLAGVLASVLVGITLGIELGLLVLAGVVLVGVVFILWGSVQALTGDTQLNLEEALSLAAPTAEEEQKRAVLRTLKDLEYERSVGKISEDDYRDLVETYRARAKELIQSVDEGIGQSREQAERLVQRQLEKLLEAGPDGAATSAKRIKKRSGPRRPQAEPAQDGPLDDEAPAEAPESPRDSDQPAGSVCGDCGLHNDADARFCKRCGTALEAAS